MPRRWQHFVRLALRTPSSSALASSPGVAASSSVSGSTRTRCLPAVSRLPRRQLHRQGDRTAAPRLPIPTAPYPPPLPPVPPPNSPTLLEPRLRRVARLGPTCL